MNISSVADFVLLNISPLFNRGHLVGLVPGRAPLLSLQKFPEKTNNESKEHTIQKNVSAPLRCFPPPFYRHVNPVQCQTNHWHISSSSSSTTHSTFRGGVALRFSVDNAGAIVIVLALVDPHRREGAQ